MLTDTIHMMFAALSFAPLAICCLAIGANVWSER